MARSYVGNTVASLMDVIRHHFVEAQLELRLLQQMRTGGTQREPATSHRDL